MSERTIDEMEIRISHGGPCIYATGVFPDGTETGRIQWLSQTKDDIKRECFESLKTGRDDCKAFVDMIMRR